MTRKTLLSTFLCLFAVACISFDLGDGTIDSGEDDGTDDGSDDGSEDGSDDGTEVEEDGITATISGTVQVELYCNDEDGNREVVSFDDAYSGSFPFGAIWVAAYDEDTGHIVYVGSDTIAAPSPDGDTFEINVEMPEEGNVRVYATLDHWNNRILASTDPIGNHPDEIEIVDGGSTSDIDMTVQAYASDYCDSGGSGGGEVSISGPVTLGGFYLQGEGAAMLLDMNGNGPSYYYGYFSPVADGSAYTADYSFGVSAALGQMQLVGVIDSNGNNLFDGSDRWGTYVEVADTNANPITVGSSDLTDMEIQIPLDDEGSPLNTVPYTTVSGAITMNDGSTFDSLAAGSTVYVAALRYRPSVSAPVTALEAGSYDMESFAWADLTGASSVNYSLVVPANTVVYLWAYADEDVDGYVNEPGEAVASGSADDSGRETVGSTSLTQDFGLAHVIVD